MREMNKILSIILILFTISTTAYSTNTKKELKRTYKILEKKTITIDTEYGSLEVKDTENKDISFEVKISVNGKKEEKTKTILENIDVIFTEGRYNLLVKTKFGDYFKFKKISNSLFNNGSIDIKIIAYIPTNLKLELKMKNGNINVRSFKEEVSIDIEKGNLIAADLIGTTIIKSKVGNLKFYNIKKGEFFTTRSTILIEDADNINMESKDSEIKIESIETLNLKSTRDNINIKQIEYLYGSSVLSKFEIDELGNEIDYAIKFGNMNIFGIHNMFTFVKLDSKAGALGLNFMKGSNYELEVKHKSVKLNISGIKTSQRNSGEKKTFITSAKVGKASSRVNIRANNCKVRID